MSRFAEPEDLFILVNYKKSKLKFIATSIVVNENGLRALPVSEVYRVLETRIEGLKGSEAERRLKLYGRNALQKKQKKNHSSLVANFTHLMAVLLWVGGLMAFLAGLPHGLFAREKSAPKRN